MSDQPTSFPPDLVEAVENAIMRSQGLDPTEVCGLEIEDGDECNSGTCCAAHFEDHDPAHARAVYRRMAEFAIAAYRAHWASDGVVQADIDVATAIVSGAKGFGVKLGPQHSAIGLVADHRRAAAGKGSSDNCPTCDSSQPHLHPSTGVEGEATFCSDAFHLKPTPQNKPEYIAKVEAVRAAEIERLRRRAEESEMFLDNAVAKAPEPLRALGEYLADLLDEDQWAKAERYLNAALANSEGKA